MSSRYVQLLPRFATVCAIWASGTLRLVTSGGWPHFVCACGAEADPVDDGRLGEPGPSYVPGALREPCTCPRCFTCHQLLDAEGRCDNLHCLNLGLHIPAPD